MFGKKFKGALLVSACMAAPAFANEDGFYNVSYRDLGISLTQIGGYGELVIEPQGFEKMGYGGCTINFKRDDSGKPVEFTPVIQSSSATCPSEVAFELAPGKDGLTQITFGEAGPLSGKSLDLFPVLQPMRDEFKVTAPANFDVLGMTIGMTRAEIEAKLAAEGFIEQEKNSNVAEYTDGSSRRTAVWGKGDVVDTIYGKNEDMIYVTYTNLYDGSMPETVEVLAREWAIPADAKVSVANLERSMAEKHGEYSSSYWRYYDRAGQLVKGAYQPVCDEAIHLQSVSSQLDMLSSREGSDLSAACGASIHTYVGESYDHKGLASRLQVKLFKGDVAYENFWGTWSRGEAKALQERYELQAGMIGNAPKL